MQAKLLGKRLPQRIVVIDDQDSLSVAHVFPTPGPAREPTGDGWNPYESDCIT
jgi:hypothetical protein